MNELSLDEIKQIQIGILDQVDSHCRANNIRYSLFFGTLLGAVRHQGYIPWDDDIDLMMPRPDYEKFLATFNQSGRYQVLSHTIVRDFPYTFAKVQDSETRLDENVGLPFKMGVNIDVFPVDGVPAEEARFEQYFRNLKRYRDALIVKMIKLDFSQRSLTKNVMLVCLKILCAPVSYRWLIKTIQYKVAKFNYEDSDHVMVACVHDNKRKHKALKDWYGEFIELEFESKKYFGIKDAGEFLTLQYGDNYMQLPPVGQRVTHHTYKAYGDITSSEDLAADDFSTTTTR